MAARRRLREILDRHGASEVKTFTPTPKQLENWAIIDAKVDAVIEKQWKAVTENREWRWRWMASAYVGFMDWVDLWVQYSPKALKLVSEGYYISYGNHYIIIELEPEPSPLV
jgi:hypothetical protein